MPRYIDADAIRYVEIGKGVEIALASDIDKLPTISPDEARGVGEWITKENGKVWWYECSCCHERPLISRFGDMENLSAYCPYCGARMKGAEDGTTD